MLELRAFGGLALHGTEPAQPKRLALLCYLALAGPRGFHRRDSLVALFWPELDDAHARQALRQALTALRALDDCLVATRGDEDVGIASGVLSCDVLAFEQAIEQGELVTAVERYTGPFLNGFFLHDCPEFERWAAAERFRLTGLAAEAAWKLAEGEQAPAAAVRWARQAAALQSDDEGALRRLVEVLDRAGDRVGALREYEMFARRLREQYQAEPAPETQALVAGVRQRGTSGNRVLTDNPRPAHSRPPVVTEQGGRAPSSRTVRLALWGVVVGVVVAGGVSLAAHRWRGLPPCAEQGSKRTAVAVLPFENLSAKGPYAYLAGGLQDEILTQLSKVAALKVISRTSVMGYAGPNIPSLPQIARELGVGCVVEASVQVAGGRLRVNVRLLDAATDAQVWAERYDRTLDDAFSIESQIAQQVVTAVGATINRAERRAVTGAPTANAEAYRLYLRGRDYARRLNHRRADREIAQQLYEQALALDSGFALAHAALSGIHHQMYQLRYDPSPERLARARQEAETALRLAPDLAEAHIAMSYVLIDDRNYPRAAQEQMLALNRQPNNASLWGDRGTLYTRMGQWSQGIAAYQRAEELDPRAPERFFMMGAVTYNRLHRYAEAVQQYDRALALAPELSGAAFARAYAFVRWRGQLDTLRAVLNRTPPELDVFAFGPASGERVKLLLLERQPDTALQVLQTAHASVYESYYMYYPSSLFAAWAHRMRGDRAAARAAFDMALVLLDSTVKELPDDWRIHAARGLAVAGLGRRGEAVREARWLRQSFNYREDVQDHMSVAEERARILAQAGELDAASDEIEKLLAGPSLLTVHTLRLDPLWDPLRTSPRFQSLLATHTGARPAARRQQRRKRPITQVTV